MNSGDEIYLVIAFNFAVNCNMRNQRTSDENKQAQCTEIHQPESIHHMEMH